MAKGFTMNILYWGESSEAFKASLESTWEDAAARVNVRQEASLAGLRTTLATQRAELSLVVLAPPSSAELAEAVTLNPLLSGIPVIVLLQTDDPETSALAHRLHPRFASVLEDDLDNVAVIATNILKYRKGMH